MADDFEGDEVALHRAIAAAPDDAAPWLVYADWLQDHGRDAEAEAVRKSLSVFQYMVQAGLRPAYVMSLIAPRSRPRLWGRPSRCGAGLSPN